MKALGAAMLLFGATGLPTGAVAAEASDLAALSLEELLASEVTSVAKRPQTVENSAAAIFVISQEDIRRSGATTLPELLRLVPGLEVAELTGDAVAVSSRGFNGLYANKLLVLIDGRAVYLSTVSGVLWGQQLVPVEDIARIEVVRGPGATLWGANAMNGVINVITKHAVDSLGVGGVARADSDGGRSASVRLGWAGERSALRVYATGRARVESPDTGRAGQAGFRYDIDLSPQLAATLQGDLQSGRFVGLDTSLSLDGRPHAGEFSGANLLGRINLTRHERRGGAVQFYWDRIERSDVLADISRDLLDIDFSQHVALGERHQVVWGGGYRLIRDRADGSALLGFEPAQRTDAWYGAYVQDEVSVIPGRLSVTAGAKLERNDYTGVEFQPSLRALARLPSGSLWAAWSRATRTPSRFEATSTVRLAGAPLAVPGLRAERLDAYEIGWRGPLGQDVSVDLTAYHNDYRRLIAWENGLYIPGLMPPRPGQPADRPSQLENVGRVRTYGMEAAAEARPHERWSLRAAASWQRLERSETLKGLQILDLDASPRHQLSLRSSLDLSPRLELDAWIRHVGPLRSRLVSAYTDLDVRLAWRATDRLEVQALGRGLLDAERVEIRSTAPGGVGRAVGRAFELSLSWRY